MTKILVILIAGLVCEAIGVVFLSKGLKQIGEVRHVHAAEIWRVVKAGATNPSILLGVALETIFFIALLVLLSRSDVSFIWPLTAMGFVLTTLAAKFFLQEQIPPLRWLECCSSCSARASSPSVRRSRSASSLPLQPGWLLPANFRRRHSPPLRSF